MLARLRSKPAFLIPFVIVALAALAFAWWTISPFFIRTSLSEGQNIAVPTAASSVNDKSNSMAATVPTATASSMAMEKPTEGAMMAKESPTAEAMMEKKPAAGVLATGNFDRKTNTLRHGRPFASPGDGSVSCLARPRRGQWPDLLSIDRTSRPAEQRPANQGGHTRQPQGDNGSFNYTLVINDPSKVKSVVIYCRAFSVIFSTAKLQQGSKAVGQVSDPPYTVHVSQRSLQDERT